MQKENNFYVYEWIRLDKNEPFYIGKGKDNRCFVLKRNQYFINIVNKVDCAVNILKDNLTEEEAFQYECWYIHEYKYEIGYSLTNMTDGGDGSAGFKCGEETKKKISLKKLGCESAFKGKKHTNKSKLKMGEKLKGKESWIKGKHHSEETKQKLSELKKGKPSKYKGKKHTEQSKINMQIGQRKHDRNGENNSFYGKTHSEETKIKMREAKIKQSKEKGTYIEKKIIMEIISLHNNGIKLCEIAKLYPQYKSYNINRQMKKMLIKIEGDK